MRLVQAEPRKGSAVEGNHGRQADIEAKVVDPSANVYLAAAAVLGAAVHGIECRTGLPAEMTADPMDCPPHLRGTEPATDQREIVVRLDSSDLVRGIVGHEVVDAVVAVRRYEVTHYPDHTPESLAEPFRPAWSVCEGSRGGRRWV